MEGVEKWLEIAESNTPPGLKATADPLKTIPVNPTSVRYRCKLHSRTSKERGHPLYDIGRIIPGAWDLEHIGDPRASLEDDVYREAMTARYVHGLEWHETRVFALKYRTIERGGQRDGCRSREELLERYRKLDAVYEDMRVNGYRVDQRFDNNIFVSIARDGELLFARGGKHRLAMASFLELGTVDMFVVARHTLWQEIREGATVGNTPRMEDHPDLIEFSSRL